MMDLERLEHVKYLVEKYSSSEAKDVLIKSQAITTYSI
jgi:hypothetical protein